MKNIIKKNVQDLFEKFFTRSLLSYNNLTIFILLFVGLLIAYQQFLTETFADTNLAYSELNNIQELTLEKLTQMTELLISLSTAIIGLVGYLSINKYKDVVSITDKEKFYAIGCISFSTLSIYFGYTCLDKWVELLANEMFNPFDPIVEYPHERQFGYFFLSLVFLGIYILTTLNNTNEIKTADQQ